MQEKILLEIKNLSKTFKVGKNSMLTAVDDVSINIYKGETVGLVGESGCGKTTFGRTLLNIYKPSSGSVNFDGNDMTSVKGDKLISFRKKAQMIFQDPYASLDPRMTIGDIVGEGIDVHFNLTRSEKNNKIEKLLKTVGLGSDYFNRYAHELSGGQRQRIGIARALAVEPEFIVCDEPISALDVSIQAQVVNLLIKLQKEMGLTYLFISHDLSMVKHISDRIGVMYLGSMIELSDNETIYKNPLHPYTQALISVIPIADPERSSINEIKLKGEIPSPINQQPGCKFKSRCPHVKDICDVERPKLVEVEKDHFVACHIVK